MLLCWRLVAPIHFDGVTILIGQIDAVRHALYGLLPVLKCLVSMWTIRVIWAILCSHDVIDVLIQEIVLSSFGFGIRQALRWIIIRTLSNVLP